MAANNEPFLESVASRWSKVAVVLSERGARSEVRSSSELAKMVIEIEHLDHLALVEAWEHAHCIDVTVVQSSSGKSTALSAGPCATEEELDKRFAALSDVLLKS